MKNKTIIILLALILIGIVYLILNQNSQQGQTEYSFSTLNRQSNISLFFLGDWRCLEMAVMYLEKNRYLILVHGKIVDDWGERIDHYWLEDEFKVYEPQLNRAWNKDYYYNMAKVKVIGKYTYEELKAESNIVGNLFPLE